jgi:hypothetical protein
MDRDELVNKRVQAIARAHSCSIDDVHGALDRYPIELNRDTYRKRTLVLELIRLDQLKMAFAGKAVVDRDVASGVLLVKMAKLDLARPASFSAGRSTSDFNGSDRIGAQCIS